MSNPRWLETANVEYLKSQIETGDPRRTKNSLQELCRLFRVGFRVQPRQVIGLEQSIIGLLYTQADDEKVRRWALNALARFGREGTCMEAIKETLRRSADEPQTAASAIAATYRLSRNPGAVLRELKFDPKMVALAALQHVDAKKLDLSALPLDVETASPDHLKLALVVVGLDRAPANMLNPRHSNAEMVKALGKHHEKVVVQYTIWATAENASLGVGDLGVDIRDLEAYPPNVRSWLFRLISMSRADAERFVEYVELGTKDPDAEARFGLSLGFRETYFDGVEPLILDWYTTEADQDVSQNVLDHIVRNARHCSSYEAMAVDVYEREAPGSILRRRMEVNAVKSPLYSKLKRIDLDDGSDLFRESHVTNINISGGVQGGAVSIGGNAANTGTTSIHYNPQTIEAIQSQLACAERELHSAPIDEAVKKEALEHVTAAKADPAPGKIERVINMLGKVETLASKTTGAATALAPIGQEIAKLAGMVFGGGGGDLGSV